MEELLKSIRESCKPGTWSRGVALSRTDTITLEDDDDEEIVLRVAIQGGMNSLEVVLFPKDIDWTCDCNHREAACHHVVGAALKLKQAREDGGELASTGSEDAPGHIAYRLDGRSGKLMLHRVVVSNGKDHRLDGSLAVLKTGKIKVPKFVASQDDLRFERKLGTFAGGLIPKPLMAKVLGALKGLKHVRLDAEPVEVGSPVSGLAVRVTEQNKRFVARLEQDKEISEVFDNGAVRMGRTLAAIGPHGLSEGEFRELRKGRVFEVNEVGTLVGDLLPRLRRHVNVVIDAPALPGSRTLKPASSW